MILGVAARLAAEIGRGVHPRHHVVAGGLGYRSRHPARAGNGRLQMLKLLCRAAVACCHGALLRLGIAVLAAREVVDQVGRHVPGRGVVNGRQHRTQPQPTHLPGSVGGQLPLCPPRW